MRQLVPTPLGKAGIERVADHVVCGPYEDGGALAAAIATNVDLSQGTVVALLPDGAGEQVDVTDLETTDVFAGLEDEGTSGEVLAKLAADAAIELARAEGAELLLCVADVTRAGYEMHRGWIGEGIVLGSDRVIFSGDSVMVCAARLSELSNDEVSWLIGPGLGLVSSVGLPPLDSTREVSQENLNAIAKGARAILVGAYDDLSLVLWRPNSASTPR